MNPGARNRPWLVVVDLAKLPNFGSRFNGEKWSDLNVLVVTGKIFKFTFTSVRSIANNHLWWKDIRKKKKWLKIYISFIGHGLFSCVQWAVKRKKWTMNTRDFEFFWKNVKPTSTISCLKKILWSTEIGPNIHSKWWFSSNFSSNFRNFIKFKNNFKN